MLLEDASANSNTLRYGTLLTYSRALLAVGATVEQYQQLRLQIFPARALGLILAPTFSLAAFRSVRFRKS